MACFLVSAAEAAVVTIVEKAEEKKEERRADSGAEKTKVRRIPLSVKLRWLKYMLLGGAVLLAFEHIWHGEVVPWFPFLTAMYDPADAAGMFREMATVGVTMALLVTVVWIGMCVVADHLVRRSEKDSAETTAV